MRKAKVLSVVVLAAIVFSAIAWAGTMYVLRCDTCRFEAKVGFGGGFTFRTVDGYCVKCGRFVQLRWHDDKDKPTLLAKVWKSDTGETWELHRCPNCSQPFLPLKSTPPYTAQYDLKYCPKCGKPSLKQQMTGTYD